MPVLRLARSHKTAERRVRQSLEKERDDAAIAIGKSMWAFLSEGGTGAAFWWRPGDGGKLLLFVDLSTLIETDQW